MFCPSCGAESTIELNYCHRCGANLSLALTANAEIAPINVTKPILKMVRNGAGPMSPALPIFGLPTILTIDILLLRQLSKLISAALSPHRLPAKKTAAQSQNELRLPRPATARLEPAPSVTENTTRFFEPVYRETRQPATRDKVED